MSENCDHKPVRHGCGGGFALLIVLFILLIIIGASCFSGRGGDYCGYGGGFDGYGGFCC
ncbi:YjcZ family sporulation protein [Bacillus pfraonensis]|uniref:YjcZ family sporulation protein n=1 Tax=Bacillus TaxID=1386 RepID=UPI002A596C20|nr:YjcZ family sporulation protein [Bacillus pseudomycoides]